MNKSLIRLLQTEASLDFRVTNISISILVYVCILAAPINISRRKYIGSISSFYIHIYVELQFVVENEGII